MLLMSSISLKYIQYILYTYVLTKSINSMEISELPMYVSIDPIFSKKIRGSDVFMFERSY